MSILQSLCFLLLLASVMPVEVNQCATSIVPLPTLVEISNCQQMPCPLTRGQTMSIQLDFFAPYYIDALKPKAIAVALGAEVTYPLLGQSDGCESLQNTKCPLEEGEYVSYVLKMDVLAIFPTISLTINFTLYDQNDNPFTCIDVDCQVV